VSLPRVATVGFASSVPGRHEQALHPTQRRLLELLDEEPGLNHTEICDELDLARGTVQYHLRELEDGDRIHSVSSGRETHYFRANVSVEEAEKLALVRAGRAMEILKAVREDPGLMQRELLAEIGMTRKVLRGYVDDLADEELVQERAVGRKRRYFPTETYEELEALLDCGGEIVVPDDEPERE
jgi:predicted transcriptional regulator